jgi:hypothetical protein
MQQAITSSQAMSHYSCNKLWQSHKLPACQPKKFSSSNSPCMATYMGTAMCVEQ